MDSVLSDFEQVLSEQLGNELEAMKKEISKAQAQLQLAEEVIYIQLGTFLYIFL